ncbi:MAG: type II secretion system major pseudopilin GspG [bacterium]|nr:type II secretion system major pseudopilin GspG [bacterium]
MTHESIGNGKREEGFTFLEIMVVVIIIGLLTTLVASNVISRGEQAKISIAKAQIQKLAQALELYRLDNGRYPTSEQGLQALITEPQSDPRPRRYPAGGYARPGDLSDPWAMEFKYVAPGTRNAHSYDIISYGPDGVEGGDADNADFGNWDELAAR